MVTYPGKSALSCPWQAELPRLPLSPLGLRPQAAPLSHEIARLMAPPQPRASQPFRRRRNRQRIRKAAPPVEPGALLESAIKLPPLTVEISHGLELPTRSDGFTNRRALWRGIARWHVHEVAIVGGLYLQARAELYRQGRLRRAGESSALAYNAADIDRWSWRSLYQEARRRQLQQLQAYTRRFGVEPVPSPLARELDAQREEARQYWGDPRPTRDEQAASRLDNYVGPSQHYICPVCRTRNSTGYADPTCMNGNCAHLGEPLLQLAEYELRRRRPYQQTRDRDGELVAYSVEGQDRAALEWAFLVYQQLLGFPDSDSYWEFVRANPGADPSDYRSMLQSQELRDALEHNRFAAKLRARQQAEQVLALDYAALAQRCLEAAGERAEQALVAREAQLLAAD